MVTSKQINWPVTTFLVTYHLILAISLPLYFTYYSPSFALVNASVVMLFLTGLSITAGYHRYFCHRSYKCHHIIEFFLLFFGSMAGQGSALNWSFIHRNHHAFIDTDLDPHSINKGFFYAHCKWLFYKQKPIDPKIVSDLMKKKLVVIQHKYYILIMIITNLLVVFFIGSVLDDFLGAFLLAFLTRFFILHHLTWFINSLGHTFGNKPFCFEYKAVNNHFISLLTFGEGYHNYHHTYANDYRAGIKWYHFDPTKWLIWILYKLKLAYSLKIVDEITIKKRLVSERKNFLLKKIKVLCQVQKDEFEKIVLETSEKIENQIVELHNQKEKYILLKNERSDREILTDIKDKMLKLVKDLNKNQFKMKKLSKYIQRLKS